jgi:mRNA-degrading endonuclease RelE of RelBE toxin-antitoxin system
LRKIYKKDKGILAAYEKCLDALENDPFSKTRAHDIKKLSGVKEGEWRVRIGRYRLRYDICDKEVVLLTLRDRKDAYR